MLCLSNPSRTHSIDKNTIFLKKEEMKIQFNHKIAPLHLDYTHSHWGIWSSSQYHFVRNKLNGTITILHTAQQQNQRYSYDNAMKIWIKFYLAIIVLICAYQHSNHTYKKTSAMKNYLANNSQFSLMLLSRAFVKNQKVKIFEWGLNFSCLIKLQEVYFRVICESFVNKILICDKNIAYTIFKHILKVFDGSW